MLILHLERNGIGVFVQEDRQSPLFLACIQDHVKVAELLLRRGANVNQANAVCMSASSDAPPCLLVTIVVSMSRHDMCFDAFV